jgi:hypothetical protein
MVPTGALAVDRQDSEARLLSICSLKVDWSGQGCHTFVAIETLCSSDSQEIDLNILGIDIGYSNLKLAYGNKGRVNNLTETSWCSSHGSLQLAI